jgi:hypothetical protein
MTTDPWMRGFAGLTFCVALAVPAVARASPPELPPPTVRNFVGAGVLFGLAFATELTGTIIATRCSPGEWCARGMFLALGSNEGPNRYTMIATGPSSAYVGARVVAAPLVTAGFTLALRGAAIWGAARPTVNDRRNRQIGRAMLGAGLGLFVVSRLLRWTFVPTGVCQTPVCVHGFDQASLWGARGLMVAGSGFSIHRRASRGPELTMGPGPAGSRGTSVVLQF